MLETLNKDFYSRESPVVAKELLGKLLVRQINGQRLIGKIVETESYLPFIDPAAHSFIGKTPRNAVIFGEAGYSYVYSIHRYFCLNAVCENIDIPGCVLIRALEPIDGIQVMQKNRLGNSQNISNGPGRLCQALQINRNLNGIDLTSKSSELQIANAPLLESSQIITTTRIGISKAKDLPLRFYIKDNKFVSRY